MTNSQRIVYSINVEDIQSVAEEKLERKLSPKEIGLVERKLGDFIHWYDAIACAIDDSIERPFKRASHGIISRKQSGYSPRIPPAKK